MQVIRTIPEVARLPEVLVFYCDGCGELETRERGSRCLLLLTRNRLRSQSAEETYGSRAIVKVTSGFEREQLIARLMRAAN